MFFRVSIPALAVVNLETLVTISSDCTAVAKPTREKTQVENFLVRAIIEPKKYIFTIISRALVMFEFQFFPLSDRGATAHYFLDPRLSFLHLH